MAILAMDFQVRDTKLVRFLPKNQHTQRKLLNFENLCSGELSKIRHHFRKLSNLKINVTGKSLSEALLFAEHGENMLCTEIVLNVKKQFLYTTCSPHVLSLEFSCIELVIQ